MNKKIITCCFVLFFLLISSGIAYASITNPTLSKDGCHGICTGIDKFHSKILIEDRFIVPVPLEEIDNIKVGETYGYIKYDNFYGKDDEFFWKIEEL